jgi:glycosyltransferase involved in cell wall biosynthesis
VLNIGRQDEAKGQWLLVESFRKVLRRHPEALLLIVGREGNASVRISAEIARQGIAGSVLLTGARDDVAELIAASDVVAVSSIWEGFGGSIVESMALGAPVVAFDVPAIREVLGGCGVLASPGETTALANGITTLLSNPAVASRVGQSGKERFHSEYELTSVAKRMAQWYFDLHDRGRLGNRKMTATGPGAASG